MCSKSVIDLDSPFVKKEKCCKVCGTTEGPMESIFCNADDSAMLSKIFKCTRVELTPVCGLISPVCGPCHRRIDAFDENAQPKVIEYVIKTELEEEQLEHDPLNIGNIPDPMAIDFKSEDDIEEAISIVRRPTKRKMKRRVIPIVHISSQQLTKRRRGRPPKVKLESLVPEVQLNEDEVKEKSNPTMRQVEEVDESEDERVENGSSPKKRVDRSPRSSSLDDEGSPVENDFSSTDDDGLSADELVSDEEESLLDDESQEKRRQGPLKKRVHLRRGRKQALRQKILKKKAANPEQCEVCGKTVSYMREHMRLHRIEKQHPCPHCDRTFVQANNLKYHIRKHLGEKPYACKQCDKQFYCEAHLKSHMRVHGPQGLFQCDLCPKSFNQECNLKKHLRVHTGEKPYSCDTCGKRFNSTSNLRNHARLHSAERPLTCEHCSKSFVDVHHLQRHIRMHTGERPYICHVCSHAFYCQNGLMDHLKTHIEKKSFKLE